MGINKLIGKRMINTVPENLKGQHRCESCREDDHEICSRGECTCSCWHAFNGVPIPEASWCARPSAGSVGRSKWLGRHAPLLTKEVHLHVRLIKGSPVWVVSLRASPICKTPGRCKKVKLEEVA